MCIRDRFGADCFGTIISMEKMMSGKKVRLSNRLSIEFANLKEATAIIVANHYLGAYILSLTSL